MTLITQFSKQQLELYFAHRITNFHTYTILNIDEFNQMTTSILPNAGIMLFTFRVCRVNYQSHDFLLIIGLTSISKYKLCDDSDENDFCFIGWISYNHVNQSHWKYQRSPHKTTSECEVWFRQFLNTI